jgi:transposase
MRTTLQSGTVASIRELERALDTLPLSKHEYLRVQAVILKKRGYRLKQIMDITRKKQVSIQKRITAYNKHGITGLLTKKRSVPTRYTLLASQKDYIKELITDHTPREYGIPHDFWSVGSVKELVQNTYGVSYKSVKSYRELLKYCGFSYQKVVYQDKRKRNEDAGHFKKRFEKKLKKGVISMWW